VPIVFLSTVSQDITTETELSILSVAVTVSKTIGVQTVDVKV